MTSDPGPYSGTSLPGIPQSLIRDSLHVRADRKNIRSWRSMDRVSCHLRVLKRVEHSAQNLLEEAFPVRSGVLGNSLQDIHFFTAQNDFRFYFHLASSRLPSGLLLFEPCRQLARFLDYLNHRFQDFAAEHAVLQLETLSNRPEASEVLVIEPDLDLVFVAVGFLVVGHGVRPVAAEWLGGLSLAARLELAVRKDLQLKLSAFRDCFAPHGHCARADIQRLGELGFAAEVGGNFFGFHGRGPHVILTEFQHSEIRKSRTTFSMLHA